MKKSLLLIGTLFSLLLSSCGNGTPSCNCDKDPTGHGDEVNLKRDTNDNYTFDDTVTNKDGSMSYEIFVRSFYDADGDGVGDLKGVEAKLPYLTSLGIKTIWLMPIHPSPSYHGYDVSDYYGINQDYGTMDDFDSLVAKAKESNIDIMIDMVLNHSSTKNPWFSKSYNDFKAGKKGTDSYADWYNWSYEFQSGYAKFGDLYYEARFDSSMPDFNLDSSTLRKEIDKISKFWINHGVKGFRLDAVLYYYYMNTDKNVEFLTWLENTTHKYDKNFYMVGEAWDNNNVVLDYHKSKCDSFFKFKSSLNGTGKDAMTEVIKASYSRPNYNANKKWALNIENYEADLKANNPNGYSSYFLSNHDMDRSEDHFEKCYLKSAVSLYGLMPGTSFIYYGEEIYLKGHRITSPDDQSDARRRLPMIWSEKDKTGECQFPEKSRPDLDNNEQVKVGAEDLLAQGWSIVNHYKKVINVRNKYPFIKHSVFTSMVDDLGSTSQYVVAYKLSLGDEYIIVVHNFNQYALEVNAIGSEILDSINTSQQIPQIQNGKLGIGAYSTVILH